MTGRLAGLSVLVTGGGSGIGRGVVDAYVAEGARVTVLERSADNADRLTGDHGDAVSVVVGDGTDPATVAEAVGTATGHDGLDHLTCCVGVFDYYASVRELAADQLTAAAGEVWRTNVLSTLLAVNAAYPALRSRRGSVTLTLSESAFHPVGGGVLYGSSKWALRGVVAHLAKDLAPEVRPGRPGTRAHDEGVEKTWSTRVWRRCRSAAATSTAPGTRVRRSSCATGIPVPRSPSAWSRPT